MLVYSTGIARNELIRGYACVVYIYVKFILYTHTHCDTHILIPFENCKPMGLKVDIAHLMCIRSFKFTFLIYILAWLQTLILQN